VRLDARRAGTLDLETIQEVQGKVSINELRKTGYSERLWGDHIGIENDAGRGASDSDSETKGGLGERVDVEHVMSGSGG